MTFRVTDPWMQRKMERWIRDNDYCYTFDDIMEGVKKGDFQTHVFGDTWLLTSIHDYPRRRTVHIDLVVGRLLEATQADPQICNWARGVGASLITGSGRPGWDPIRAVLGWRMTGYQYSKELKDV